MVTVRSMSDPKVAASLNHHPSMGVSPESPAQMVVALVLLSKCALCVSSLGKGLVNLASAASCVIFCFFSQPYEFHLFLESESPLLPVREDVSFERK